MKGSRHAHSHTSDLIEEVDIPRMLSVMEACDRSISSAELRVIVRGVHHPLCAPVLFIRIFRAIVQSPEKLAFNGHEQNKARSVALPRCDACPMCTSMARISKSVPPPKCQ